MAKINLLPWREERREELKKEFLTVLTAVVVGALALLFLADRTYNHWIDGQTARNRYLQTNIDNLNKEVAEISELESKKEQLLERMKIIQALQGNRPIIVRVFDELVRTVPDGVFYRELTREKDVIKIEGTAESNNRVSSLMRKLDASDWFSNPNLIGVKASEAFGDQGNDFNLSVNITLPADALEGENK